ncbi:MAG: chromate transporter [Kaiparowitsia implicata GSE-PSE-MK54-09C]|jgi:chromate transporter|nr:chromate transporter [Kaiparowitsia implicata GSE-PSE-MK54-09C]
MNRYDDQHNNREQKGRPVTDLILFWTFFRIGSLTLGGGLAMATVMRHELVLKRQWLTDEDFMAEMSLATLVPGAIAVNVAYLQGRRLRGKAGAATAVFATVLPAFGLILLIANVALLYFNHLWVAAFLRGCAIAVGGQLAFAGFIFGRRYLRNWQNAVVCAVGLAIVAGLQWHPVAAVLATGGLGYLLCKPSQPSDLLPE